MISPKPLMVQCLFCISRMFQSGESVNVDLSRNHMISPKPLMVQCLFCISRMFQSGESVNVLIGWGAPAASADPVANRRHFWTVPCCLQCLQQLQYVAIQPNPHQPWRTHLLAAQQLPCLPQPE